MGTTRPYTSLQRTRLVATEFPVHCEDRLTQQAKANTETESTHLGIGSWWREQIGGLKIWVRAPLAIGRPPMLAQAASPPADMVSSAPSSSSAMSQTKCPAEPTPSNPEHTCSTHAPPPPPSSKLKCVHCASVLYGPFCGQCGSDSLDSLPFHRL